MFDQIQHSLLCRNTGRQTILHLQHSDPLSVNYLLFSPEFEFNQAILLKQLQLKWGMRTRSVKLNANILYEELNIVEHPRMTSNNVLCVHVQTFASLDIDMVVARLGDRQRKATKNYWRCVMEFSSVFVAMPLQCHDFLCFRVALWLFFGLWPDHRLSALVISRIYLCFYSFIFVFTHISEQDQGNNR